MPRVAPRPWPKGKPSPLRGTRHAWVGTWGDFRDGRSRLSTLARKREREMLEEYVVTTPRQRERVKRAAQMEALAEMVRQGIGTDGKVTGTTWRKLLRSAEGQLAGLRTKAMDAPKPTPADVAARLRAEVGR